MLSWQTSTESITTLLIPEMNFKCNVTVVGFNVAGRNFFRSPYFKIKIYRERYSAYYQVGHDIFVNVANGGDVCVASKTTGTLTWCILHDIFKLSVQSGDILGLELPRTNDDEISFIRGEPVNYIFEGQLGSAVSNLSSNGSFSQIQQLPQILFDLTSGEVLCYQCIYSLNSLQG